MKKIVFLLCAALLCQWIGAAADVQETQEETMDSSYSLAHAVLEEILRDPLEANGEPETPVTRKGFLTDFFNLMDMTPVYQNTFTFSDVAHGAPGSDEIYTALALGWICAAEEFHPDDVITWNEIIKITVCAMNYGKMAENQGGYPVGHRIVAQNADLLRNIREGEPVTNKSVSKLFYNFLNTKMVRISYQNGGYAYQAAEDTYLTGMYHIEKYTGLITATTFNAIDYTLPVGKSGYIEINGQRLPCDEVEATWLGYACEAFYDRDKEKIVALVRQKNETMSLSLDEITFDGGRLVYEDTGKRISMGSETVFVYNGRTVGELKPEYFQDTSGTAVFVDNNRDGIYDFVHLTVYDYISVAVIERERGYITDQNDSEKIIDLEQTQYPPIFSENGEEISIYNLHQGDLLQCTQRSTVALVNIERLTQSVSGTVTAIEPSDGSIYIDNVLYETTNYFKVHYLKEIDVGMSGIFIVANGSKLAGVTAQDQYQYGFVAKTAYENSLDSSVQMKVFTEKNDFVIYTVPETVRIDGMRVAQDAYRSAISQMEGTVIRFLANTAGEMYNIDTAAEFSDDLDREQLDQEDKLLKYHFGSVRYRSNQTFSPYFNVAGTVIFKIPTDTSLESKYLAGTSDMFSSGDDYDLEVYDLDEYGSAALAVYRFEAVDEGFFNSDASYVIESVHKGLDEEGLVTDVVNCWSNGTYYKFYLEAGTIVRKESGSGLCGGDIARFKIRDGKYITSVCVDFDAAEGFFGKNAYSPASFNTTNAAVGFLTGVIHTASDKYAYMSHSVNGDGTIDTTFSSLKNYSLDGAPVICYDREKQVLRPIDTDEIKTYFSYGTDADYVVIRQNYNSSKLIVAYR